MTLPGGTDRALRRLERQAHGDDPDRPTSCTNPDRIAQLYGMTVDDARAALADGAVFYVEEM